MELQENVKNNHPHLHGFIEISSIVVGLVVLLWLMI